MTNEFQGVIVTGAKGRGTAFFKAVAYVSTFAAQRVNYRRSV